MKTAIIKTDYWKEDKIFELLPDARYYYLCLLTNPERNATPAFKCSDRLMVAYTGYNVDTIKICKDQLTEKGLIIIVDDYYIINDQDFVSISKGKLSSQLYEKEFNLLPLNVQNLLLNRSGATPERISNSISISKSNGISNSKSKELKPIEKPAMDLAVALSKAMSRNRQLQGKELKAYSASKIEGWAKHIEKLHTIDGEDYETIYMVLMWCQQDLFWKSNILSGAKFREKYDQLLIKAISEQQKAQSDKARYGAEIAGVEGMPGMEIAK